MRGGCVWASMEGANISNSSTSAILAPVTSTFHSSREGSSALSVVRETAYLLAFLGQFSPDSFRRPFCGVAMVSSLRDGRCPHAKLIQSACNRKLFGAHLLTARAPGSDIWCCKCSVPWEQQGGHWDTLTPLGQNQAI